MDSLLCLFIGFSGREGEGGSIRFCTSSKNVDTICLDRLRGFFFIFSAASCICSPRPSKILRDSFKLFRGGLFYLKLLDFFFCVVLYFLFFERFRDLIHPILRSCFM